MKQGPGPGFQVVLNIPQLQFGSARTSMNYSLAPVSRQVEDVPQCVRTASHWY